MIIKYERWNIWDIFTSLHWLFLLCSFRPGHWYTVKEEHAIQTDVFTLDSTQEIYIPNDNQEISLQTYTHNFSLEFRMVEILADLNWKWKWGNENNWSW